MQRAASAAGTLRAFFRGNGTNVIKITPETAIKLAANDYIKRCVVAEGEHITPVQRLQCGALAGATAQARAGAVVQSCPNPRALPCPRWQGDCRQAK